MSSFFFLVTTICYIHETSIPHSNRFQQVENPYFYTFFSKTVYIFPELYYIFEKIKSFFLFFRKKGIMKENKQ